ncbi:helix-turn-helix domain-containing protein [Macrococcus psychrotolerans]|uniref:Helix-turn-helix domain-containing protein n=1 Tax=Macrococcus psychrotolerans TaxID=3039389 RepID=A0AAU6REL6_9STAP
MLKIDALEVRGLIAKKGYSLRSFSKENDMSISYLSTILNNKANPGPKMAKRIADALGVEIEDIFEFDIKEEVR